MHNFINRISKLYVYKACFKDMEYLYFSITFIYSIKKKSFTFYNS